MEYLIETVPPDVVPTAEATSVGEVVSPLANTMTVDVTALRRKAQKAFRQITTSLKSSKSSLSPKSTKG